MSDTHRLILLIAIAGLIVALAAFGLDPEKALSALTGLVVAGTAALAGRK